MPFWHAPWLQGRKPKDIAPLIFDVSIGKSSKVAQATQNNAWIHKIKLGNGFTVEHLRQCVELWALIQNVELCEEMDDDISWKLTANGEYSAKSAYEDLDGGPP